MARWLLGVAFVGAAAVSVSPVLAQTATPAVVPAFETTPVASPTSPPAATPATAPDAPPTLPEGSSPGQAIPALGPDGLYVTPNRGLTREETVWHMRAALNVAALGCRNSAPIVAGYNAMLSAKKAELTAAMAGVDQRYRARFSGQWQARIDDAMTKLYNFFAQPPAQQAFCAAAEQVLSEAATVAPSAFADFAEGALPRLEAPFLAFYASYARYQANLADWHARAAARVALASTSTGSTTGEAIVVAAVLPVVLQPAASTPAAIQTAAVAVAAPSEPAEVAATPAARPMTAAFTTMTGAPTANRAEGGMMMASATTVAPQTTITERRYLGPGEP